MSPKKHEVIARKMAEMRRSRETAASRGAAAMADGAIDATKRAAIERNGDVLALRALDRVREAAYARGDVRTRRPSAARIFEEARSRETHDADEPLGDEVQNPGPGWGDVGSGPRPSHQGPHPIGQILARYVRDKGWRERLGVAFVASRWPEIVGPTVTKHCTVEDFSDGGRLALRTSLTPWETQIRALQATLETTPTKGAGEGVVKEIVVKGSSQPSWKHGRFLVQGRGPRDTYG